MTGGQEKEYERDCFAGKFSLRVRSGRELAHLVLENIRKYYAKAMQPDSARPGAKRFVAIAWAVA